MSAKALDSFAKNDDAVLLTVAIVGIVVVYLVLKNAVSGIASGLSSAIDTADKAVDSATTSIANAYTAATLPPSVNPTGAIVFPDGSTATVAAVSASNNGLQSPIFYWDGLQYQLTGNFDALGNRVAQAGPDANTGLGSTWG